MKRASWLAFVVVFMSVAGSFVWWAKNRPSYLLYQAHHHLGRSEQAAVITKYKKLLQKKDLPLDQEIQLRKSLGEFYLRAVQEGTEFSIYMRDDYEFGRPLLSSAKKEFQTILAKVPDDAFSHYALGRILLWEKLDGFALEELKLSVKGMPENPDPLRILSLVYQERGEAALGLEYALRAVAVNMEHDDSRRALISAYVLLGQREKALAEYENLSSDEREHPEVRAQFAMLLSDMNYWDRAKSEMNAVLNLHPQNGVVRLLYGQMLLKQGRLEESVGQLAQAADFLPHHIWPLVWQAEAYSGLGRCSEVARVGQLMIEWFPRWAWAHLINAKALHCQNNPVAAMRALEESLRLSPDFPEARKTKAQWLMDQQRFSELGSFLRPWLDEKANEAHAYILLAESFFHQEKMQLCAEMAESSIRLDSRDWRSFYWLGAARQKMGDRIGANGAFQNALSINSKDSDLLGGMAYLRGETNSLQDLLRIQGRNYRGWSQLGELYLQKQEYSDALLSFQRAASLRPSYLAAQIGIVNAAWASGDQATADAALRMALEINSTHKEVLSWRSKIRKR